MSKIMQDTTGVFLTLFICTSLGLALSSYSPLHRVDIAMVFLLGVVIVSLRVRSRIALLMPLLSVGTFIIFFVPPGLAAVSGKTGYVVTLIVMSTVALMISGLVERLRRQEVKTNESFVALELEQLRGQLLSSVSHDLRTPLAGIAGAASSLLAAELDQHRRDDLAKSIFDQAQRLNRVLKNILDITRFENGVIQPQKEWHDIDELVGVALDQLDSELSQIKVEIEYSNSVPLFLIDGVLVEQLLLNLLDNAAKYADGEGCIKIKIGNQGQHLIIEVQNPAENFSSEIEKQMFEKFFRSPGHSYIVGSGLGLTICKAIAELHGGSINALYRDRKLSLITKIPAEQKTNALPIDEDSNEQINEQNKIEEKNLWLSQKS